MKRVQRRLRLGDLRRRNNREPVLIEKPDLTRDNALGQDAGKLEQGVGCKAVAHLRHNLGAVAVALDHADGVEVLLDHEMDVLESLAGTSDRQCGTESQSGNCTATEPPQNPVVLSLAPHLCGAK